MAFVSNRNNLSKFLTVIFVFCCIAFAAAFDWKEKPTAELHADMVTYVQAAAAECSDQKLAKALERFAQDQAKPSKDTSAWISETHAFFKKQLTLYPPTVENSKQREYIQRILDYPLHVNNYDKAISEADYNAYAKATQDYFETAKKNVLKNLKKIKPPKGQSAVIWHIYNMGFIIKTSKHTVGIDIAGPAVMPGRSGGSIAFNPWPTADIAKLAASLDILFVTHNHGDHFNSSLLKAMLSSGKPVVLAAPLAFLGDNSKNLTVINTSQETPLKLAGIEILAFRGNQGEKVPCNVYLLDIDGVRVIHDGDNYDRSQEAKIKNYPAANIIIGATWNDIIGLTKSAQSAPDSEKANQLLLPSHENELGHSVGHRESYLELYTRTDRMGNKEFKYPEFRVLNCGEAIFYPSLKPLTTK